LLSPSLGAIEAGAFAIGLYTFSNIVYAVIGYPIGVLSDKYSKKTILSIGYAIFGLLCFGFIFAGSSMTILGLLFALIGIYTAIIESSQPALASMLISRKLRGTGFGVMSAIDGIGDFLSSIIVGFLWTLTSPAIGLGFGGVLAIIASFSMFTINLNGKRNTSEANTL
jgi:MFS family permease